MAPNETVRFAVGGVLSRGGGDVFNGDSDRGQIRREEPCFNFVLLRRYGIAGGGIGEEVCFPRAVHDVELPHAYPLFDAEEAHVGHLV